jgi:hypothetical protein
MKTIIRHLCLLTYYLVAMGLVAVAFWWYSPRAKTWWISTGGTMIRRGGEGDSSEVAVGAGCAGLSVSACFGRV